MTLKILQPTQFEPIWAEYENWSAEQRTQWADRNMGSDNRRRQYIGEQLEFAKERRIAELTASALRTEIEAIVKSVIASGVLRGK